jgi:DNA-binding LytR/AlgR family response regulator
VLETEIKNKNKPNVLKVLGDIKTAIDVEKDVEAVTYIINPENLTRIQKALCEQMGVMHRYLQLRNRVHSASRRASLFIQAMINGVEKLNV